MTETGSAVLTINAGAELRMGSGQIIRVVDNGGLTLAGTADEHVVITAAGASPAAGDWSEIDIDIGSQDDHNIFNYADIYYSGGVGYGQLWIEAGASCTVNNVVFADGETCDIYADGTLVEQGSNTFVRCAK